MVPTTPHTDSPNFPSHIIFPKSSHGYETFSRIICFITRSLLPIREVANLRLTGKAFENVLDKYRFAPDDGSASDNFLPVRVTILLTCQYLLGTKSDPRATLLVIGFLAFLAAWRWYLFCGLSRPSHASQPVLPLPHSNLGLQFPRSINDSSEVMGQLSPMW